MNIDGYDEEFEFNSSLGFKGSDQLSSNDIDPSLLNDRSVRTSRLKEFVFPDNDITLPLNTGAGKNGQIFFATVKLQKPSQRMKYVVTNFIDYIEDTDTSVAAAGNLARLLKGNPNDSAQALAFVHNLCRKQASRLGLSTHSQIVEGVRDILSTTKNQDTVVECASILQHISKSEIGSIKIVQADIIPMLLEMLKSSNKKIADYSISTLDNVMINVEQSKEIVRRAGGLDKMILEMERTDARFLTVLLSCIHRLLFNNPQAKKRMLETHGSERVVQIMRQYTYNKLIFTASRIVKVLSVCEANKPVLVEVGAIEALNSLLQKNPSLVQSCLWSIRNLSDHAAHLPGMERLIKILIEMLGCDTDDHIPICAIGALCNITSGATGNKVAFVDYGGVEATCQLICEMCSQEAAVEPAAAALRHVTHSNPRSDVAIKSIIQSPILSNLAVLIRSQPDRMLPLVKAIIGLIRNLAVTSSECRRLLIDLGVIDSICEIFNRTYSGMQELCKQRSSIVSISSEISFVEGVRLEDMLELLASALQGLVKEDYGKKIVMYQNKLLQTVVHIVMKESSPPLQRACLGLLAEMISYGDCIHYIEGEGFNSRLSELINAPNKAIATYAAILMCGLNRNKPIEYQNRLKKELFESLNKQFLEDEEEEDRRMSKAVIDDSQMGKVSVDYRNLPNVPKGKPKYYDNNAYLDDFDDMSSPSKNKGKSRQKERQPFTDVEL